MENFSNTDAVSIVSTNKTYEAPCGAEKVNKRIGIMDFGIKQNIIRSFHKRNCDLMIFPWNTTAEEILSYNLD
jgi:carbamoyl-phosphate synthase small subunit